MLGNGGVKNLKKNSRGAFTVGEGWKACLPCTPRFVKIATTKAVRAANHVAESRFLVDLVHHNAAIVHAIALDGVLLCEECIEQCLSGLDL